MRIFEIFAFVVRKLAAMSAQAYSPASRYQRLCTYNMRNGIRDQLLSIIFANEIRYEIILIVLFFLCRFHHSLCIIAMHWRNVCIGTRLARNAMCIIYIANVWQSDRAATEPVALPRCRDDDNHALLSHFVMCQHRPYDLNPFAIANTLSAQLHTMFGTHNRMNQ